MLEVNNNLNFNNIDRPLLFVKNGEMVAQKNQLELTSFYFFQAVESFNLVNEVDSAISSFIDQIPADEQALIPKDQFSRLINKLIGICDNATLTQYLELIEKQAQTHTKTSYINLFTFLLFSHLLKKETNKQESI